jgi:hypothetical protein
MPIRHRGTLASVRVGRATPAAQWRQADQVQRGLAESDAERRNGGKGLRLVGAHRRRL